MRLWFRRNGAADGLWWTVECEGVERHASVVRGNGAFVTQAMPGPAEDTPLSERRHVLAFEANEVSWSGTVATLSMRAAVVMPARAS